MNAISQTKFVRRPASNAPLFEALVCETHHAAAMSAIVASCINGSAKGSHRLDHTQVDRFFPAKPAVLMSLTRRSLLEVEPLAETQDVIDAFFDAMRGLRHALDTYFDDAAAIGADRASVVQARRMSNAAGSLCHEALRAVHALEIETPGRLPALYCDHAAALTRLLLDAERGGTPCLDRKGSPFLPELPQRRHSTRRTLGQNCRLLYHKVVVSAFAKDISEGGIGLLRAPFLRTDDLVTVELDNGRRFRGLVAWTRGEAAGVRFFGMLSSTDPLLAI